jgi:hypothetical protein
VTQDKLAGALETLAPDLSGASDSGWARFRREVGTIFTVRRDGRLSPRAVDRVEHARRLLASGDYEAAANEVARLPDAGKARDWIAATRRFAAAEKGLELIETAALLESGPALAAPALPPTLPPTPGLPSPRAIRAARPTPRALRP